MAGNTEQKKKQSTEKSKNTGSNRSTNGKKSLAQKTQQKEKKGMLKVLDGSENKKEIYALVLIGICAFIIVSIFEKAGFLGKIVKGILFGFFGGFSALLIIIITVAVAVSILRGTENRYFSFRRNIFLGLFILFASAFVQTCTNAYADYCSGNTGFFEFIKYLWDYEPAIFSGGLIGGGISFLMQLLMGRIASLIVLGVMTVILANVLFSFSVAKIYKRSAVFFKGIKDKVDDFSYRMREKNTEKEQNEKVKVKKSGKDTSYVKYFEPEDFDDADVDDSETGIEDDFRYNAFGDFEYNELPYAEEASKEYAEEITEDGELIFVPARDRRTDKSADDKKAKEETNKNEADSEAKAPEQAAESSKDPEIGHKPPEIHMPGTVADASLDGLVFSKESAVPYRFPGTDLLDIEKNRRNPTLERNQAAANARKLEAVMRSFGIEAKVTNYSIGPTVTRYELIPSVGVRVSKIKNLSDDIALNLAAESIRIEAPIPGKAAIGIEIPNKEKRTVYFREIIESDAFRYNRSKLAACLGSGISGEPVVVDLAKMPHLMIAGTTGSGKSVCTNGIIMSMLFNASPEEVKFILIDPKMVEFSKYNGIPHLLLPVVTEPKKAASALAWAVDQMEKRYKLLAMYGVRDLKSYNAYAETHGLSKMPTIVIIIDELADLMMVARDSVETAINRIAQKARAAGMHLVVATQRPSVDVITGLIKSNIPVRIALKVSSQVDSRTIIDVTGAEKLLGRGDMLYHSPESSKDLRIQGAYVSDNEIESVVDCIMQTSTAEYAQDVMQKVDEGMVTPTAADKSGGDESGLSDDEILFRKAVKIAIETKSISVSMLQRKFNIGFNRAGRIVDMMEERGIVSCRDGSNARKILVDSYDFGDDN